MIKVNGKDFSATVGGSFNLALISIKAIAGRSYNAQNKSWTVPVSKSEFIRAMKGFSIVFSDGSHMTSYKNYHTSQEWEVAQQLRKVEADRMTAWRAINAELRFHCESITGDKKLGNGLFELIFNGEMSRSNFSTEERYELTSIIRDWYEFAVETNTAKFDAIAEEINGVFVQ